MLIDFEIKHHLQPFAGVTEVLQVRVRADVCPSEDDRRSLSPVQESLNALNISYCSVGLVRPAPFFAMTNGTASILKPETPSCNQKPMILRISACTSGLAVVRSG